MTSDSTILIHRSSGQSAGRPLRASPRHVAAAAALFSLAYLGAALLGHALTLEPSRIATFWPAAGLYLAALLLATPVGPGPTVTLVANSLHPHEAF